MIGIGKMNTMKVLRLTPPGAFLGIAGEGEEILLPNKYIPEGLAPEDEIEVFIYKDSEDRLIATTLTPKIQRDEFGFLMIKQIAPFGAFLDWGLEKDLLVPNNEQSSKLQEGKAYIVYLYLDVETWRLIASTKVRKFFETEDIELEKGEKVNILVYDKTDLGYKVIINHLYDGLIFHSEVFQRLQVGDTTVGYVKNIREDKKVDVVLQPLGMAAIEPNAATLLDLLEQNNGFLSLTDKTDPQKISQWTGMSKKLFKKTVGALYKARKITIADDGIYLVK